MPDTAPIVTIIGGSGFVGRYIAQNMARRGWRVRVACRRPNEAMFVKPYGAVGQVEPVQCNVRDEASMARVIEGSDAVVYSVGVLFESGKNGFDAVQAEGPARAARLAAAAGHFAFCPDLGHRRGCRQPLALCALQGCGRGRRARAHARRGHPAPLDRLWHRGRVLQSLWRDGASVARGAHCRRVDAVPAGLGSGCRRCRGQGRGWRGSARRLRAWRPAGLHVPRADRADAPCHAQAPPDRRHSLLHRAHPGKGFSRSCRTRRSPRIRFACSSATMSSPRARRGSTWLGSRRPRPKGSSRAISTPIAPTASTRP